jgi:hypothetical protein
MEKVDWDDGTSALAAIPVAPGLTRGAAPFQTQGFPLFSSRLCVFAPII